MSEPQKQPEKKSFWSTKNLLILGLLFVSIGVVFGYFAYYSGESALEPAQQSPPNVIPKITNAMNPDKFDINNFDECVKLLIDYVKSVEIFDSTKTSTNKIKVNDIMAQYDSLNCPLVESQLSQTDQYKNRNDLEQ